IIVYFYGWFTSSSHPPVREVCNAVHDDFYRCPLSETGTFTRMSEACKLRRSIYSHTNLMSVMFSIYVIVWSATLFESWRKYIQELTRTWEKPSSIQNTEPP